MPNVSSYYSACVCLSLGGQLTEARAWSRVNTYRPPEVPQQQVRKPVIQPEPKQKPPVPGHPTNEAPQDATVSLAGPESGGHSGLSAHQAATAANWSSGHGPSRADAAHMIHVTGPAEDRRSAEELELLAQNALLKERLAQLHKR